MSILNSKNSRNTGLQSNGDNGSDNKPSTAHAVPFNSIRKLYTPSPIPMGMQYEVNQCIASAISFDPSECEAFSVNTFFNLRDYTERIPDQILDEYSDSEDGYSGDIESIECEYPEIETDDDFDIIPDDDQYLEYEEDYLEDALDEREYSFDEEAASLESGYTDSEDYDPETAHDEGGYLDSEDYHSEAAKDEDEYSYSEDYDWVTDAYEPSCKKIRYTALPNQNVYSPNVEKIKLNAILGLSQPICTFKKLETYDNAYSEIRQLIINSGDISRIKIVLVERIENLYLQKMYNLKKFELQVNGVKELVLFHGTYLKNSERICSENFNYRLNGSHKGVRYGRGVYFSPNFFYSSWYCGKDEQKTMLVSKVLFCKSHEGNANTVVPRDGFDTTEKPGREIVKYDDDVFCPIYRIQFIKYR